MHSFEAKYDRRVINANTEKNTWRILQDTLDVVIVKSTTH